MCYIFRRKNICSMKTTRKKPSHNPKSGFYARQFNEGEKTDLEILLGDGLNDEIAMMRVLMRRVFESANELIDLSSGEPGDVERAVNLLGTMGVAATRLERLLRAQKTLTVSDTEFAGTLSEALAEVVKELGAK